MFASASSPTLRIVARFAAAESQTKVSTTSLLLVDKPLNMKHECSRNCSGSNRRYDATKSLRGATDCFVWIAFHKADDVFRRRTAGAFTTCHIAIWQTSERLCHGMRMSKRPANLQFTAGFEGCATRSIARDTSGELLGIRSIPRLNSTPN